MTQREIDVLVATWLVHHVGSAFMAPEAWSTFRTEHAAEIAKLGLEVWKVDEGRPDDTSWSFEFMWCLMEKGTAEAWRVLLELVRCAPEAALGCIGAGPMEDFFDDRTASVFEGPVETALADPKFRTAFDSAWNVPWALRELRKRFPAPG